MSDLAERLALLSPEKREMFLRQMRMKKGGTQEQIPPQAREEDGIPLSFAQQQLWFMHQLKPQSPFYNMHSAFRLYGRLHMDALELSLATVVQRHEILRTTFDDRGGRPIQVIAPCGASPPPTVQVPVIDLRGLATAEREQQATQLARAEALRPFDLVNGPLLRVYLLQLNVGTDGAGAVGTGQAPIHTPTSPCTVSCTDHVLLFTLHHIVSDGWSMGVLVREMTTLYQTHMNGELAGKAQGTVPTLPKLPIQYADYAIWQRQWLQGIGAGQALGKGAIGTGIAPVQGANPSPTPTVPDLQSQLVYWRQQLAGAPGRGQTPSLQLPTDRPRPAMQRYAGDQQSRLLSLELLEQLKSLSQQEGVTLFMTLLATFQVLLMRYSDQQDIVVGTSIANRTREELKGLIGFFVNMLVLRTDLSGNPSFLQLLARVREVALQAYEHQDIPFEKLVEELQPERDLSRAPLFQVLFSLETYGTGPQAPPMGQAHRLHRLELPGLDFRPIPVESQTAKFDLSLMLSEEQAGLLTMVEYNTDLFDVATITRLLGHWQVLLEAIVHDPGQPIETLPLLTETEHAVLAQGTAPTAQWNATTVGTRRDTDDRKGSSLRPLSACACPPLQDLCLHQLFEQQVERTPEAIAVVFEDATLTYRELDDRANQLAHVLQRTCASWQERVGTRTGAVGPVRIPTAPTRPYTGSDVLVGVCMERSLELVIGLLAILKAGAAYVPLDPNYPAERLAWMLTDAQPVVVLTQTHLMTALSSHHGQFICLDVDWEDLIQDLAEQANMPCPTSVTPQNLAYVIYTSGSTGNPKGVMNTHQGICNTLLWAQGVYQLTQGDCLLQRISPSFDPALKEIFWPLITGAKLVIAPPERYQDISFFVSLLARYAITVLAIVPSVLQILISEGGPNWRECQDLRLVMCGGESLSLELQNRFFASHSASLWNIYGPTEAAIDATAWQCEPEPCHSGVAGPAYSRVPIGHPIANTQIYLLDKHQQPVPVGIPAELYIGGVNLARGYLNRADLTAERFIPHPSVGTGSAVTCGLAPQVYTIPTAPVRAGERLYRTGDLARYRSDGAIEYLGRIDQQVKLRGFRIELGEIEAVLHTHPAVQECVVVLQEEHETRKGLVAYVVPAPSQLEARDFEPPTSIEDVRQEPLIVLTLPDLQGYLREQLPDYMVPANVVFLESLPLTPNGKVDRNALPIFDPMGRRGDSLRSPIGYNETQVAPVSGAEPSAAQDTQVITPLQEVLVTVWKEVLDLPQVGIYDNFFALGGHSLLVTQVVSRIHQMIGVDLPLESLFEAPTLAALADHLEELVHGSPSTNVPTPDRSLRSMDRPIDLPLSFAQERLWFLNKWALGSAWYNVPMAFRLVGLLHVRALERSLATVVQRHEVLRTSFVERAGQPVQVIAPTLPILVPVIDLRGLAAAERDQQVTQLARAEAQLPFDLAKGPLLRMYLLRLDAAYGRVSRVDIWESESVGAAACPCPGSPLTAPLGQGQAAAPTKYLPLKGQAPILQAPHAAPCTDPTAVDGSLEPSSEGTDLAVAAGLPRLPFNHSHNHCSSLVTASQEHVLLFMLHHIVSDGWSGGVLAREITALYQAEMNGGYSGQAQGTVPTLPELPLQYADYALWQRQWLQGEVLDTQLTYWRKRLAEISPLELPTDHPRPAIKTDKGASQSRFLPLALSKELLALSQQQDVTLFMLLLGTFQVLLMRYTGQTDICVGTPIANRMQAELEELIGCFVNTLVLRTDLGGNPTFEQFLRRVRETCLGAYVHQDIPFEKVVEEIEPERDMSRSPLFQVMFVMQNTPAASGLAPQEALVGISIEPLTLPTGTSCKFDLTLALIETEQGLHCALEYSTDLFEADTITRWLTHWQTLLEGVVQNPQAHISDLPLLTAAEQAQILAQGTGLTEWNAIPCDHPQGLSLHQLIERQVEQTPDAIAVVFDPVTCRNCGNRRKAGSAQGTGQGQALSAPIGPSACACPGFASHMSYYELNSQANHLARRLRQECIGPNVLVGVCMERSLELVVALLAILKTGGAYVPLDPTYPQERLLYMIRDAQITVLLTQSDLRERLPEGRVTIITVDPSRNVEIAAQEHTAVDGSLEPPSEGTDLAAVGIVQTCGARHTGYSADPGLPRLSFNLADDRCNPVSTTQPDHLAYVIYTSGTTGSPKGAGVYHRGFMNLLQWYMHEFALTAQDRVLLCTSFSFDLTEKNIFAPLMVGGILSLLEPGYYDPSTIVCTIMEQEITLLNCTPSAFYPLLDSTKKEAFAPLASLKHLILGGEPISPSRLWPWVTSTYCQAEIVNTYGPTECTDVVAYHRLQEYQRYQNTAIPLGKPINNVQLLVLDRYLQLLPLGAVGELYIAGDSVGIGYINASQQTEACFIANPFDTIASDRLYKSGDLVSYLPDGTLKFIGRADHQVKIRGFRIELEEIEAELSKHPAIKAVACVPRAVGIGEDTSDNKQLVAYLVADPDAPHPSIENLRLSLKEKLPAYMVPDIFIYLNTLPLSPNGKVDRKALLEIEDPRSRADLWGRRDSALRLSDHGYSQNEVPMVLSYGASPQAMLQELLATIWKDVLHLPQVGVHDNFFELGGHSLLATQVVARIRQVIGVDLPLRSLFETPTIAPLARHLEGLMRSVPSIHIPLEPARRLRTPVGAWACPHPGFPARENGRGQAHAPTKDLPLKADHMPLSFAQERLWFLSQLAEENAWYNVPIALRLSGPLDVLVLERSLATVVQRHEVLRTTFASLEGRPVQVITPFGVVGALQGSCPQATIQVPVIDLSGLATAEREQQTTQLARVEAQRPFDLANGPLLRVYLLRLDVGADGAGTSPAPTSSCPVSCTDHVLLFTLHHIVCDGWSMSVLVHEVTTLYQAQINGESPGQAPTLPELPIQYADYALWQRQWLQGEVLQSHLAYWQQQLAGAPGRGQAPSLQLPTDRPRPAVQTNAGERLALLLSPVLLQELKGVSQREGATLFMTLLAAFQVLLMRYTGKLDIVVGTPIANRGHAGLEDLIGFFVNTLVLRSDLSGNPRFLQLLARVREMALQAYMHQDLPFEKLVESLHVERSLSYSPLFQVFFALQNVPNTDLVLQGLTIRQLKSTHCSTQFDLSLELTEEQAGLQTVVEYNTDLFDAATITRLLGHWQALLEAIVRDPEQDIETISLLTPREREQLLVEWNTTQGAERRGTDDPKGSSLQSLSMPLWQGWQDQCLHQFFEQQVELTPDAIAVTFGGDGTPHLTYQQLNGQANQLAYRLREVCIGPDRLVGVCMERSLELVIALLAVLKAGGAYVPFDPKYPTERLAFMRDNAQIGLVITTSTQMATTKLDTAHFQTICLDRDWLTIAEQGKENLASGVLAEDLAYVIYTSGSTGTPKGVAVPHRAIVNRLLWSQQAFPLTSRDRVLQIASFSFDIALWELFAPLIAGARVLLTPADVAQDTGGLVHWLIEQAFTVAHAVPSLLRAWLQEPAFRQTQELRHLFCGGEAWWPGLAQSFAEQHHASLTQWYGPTEAAISVTSWTCPTSGTTNDRKGGEGARPSSAPRHLDAQEAMSIHRGTDDGQAQADRGKPLSLRVPTTASRPLRSPEIAPIGRPIANTQIYLLDRNGQPVPAGVTGEIYLAGACLARGYVGQPALTAERFVPNPFVVGSGSAQGTIPTCPEPGARLYRTGDHARYLADGQLEFLGRQDQQVKVRGIRVELGEIEAVLLQHPAVHEAVVLVLEDTPENKCLIAYLVLQPEQKQRELWPSIGEYFVYDELIYTGLTKDETRNALYKTALEQTVAGKVVVDVGTGRDAILARLCVEAGAKRVYAIELLEESYQHAQACINQLGLQEQIKVLHGDATQVQLPEQAEVCVTEIFEAIGGAEGAGVILNNIRRLLTPQATMIPRRSLTRIAAVRLPDELREQPAFTEASSHYVRKIFEQVGYPFDLRLCIKNFPSSHLISDAEIFEDLDYTGQAEPEYSRQVRLIIRQQTQLDGFLLWLILDLAPGQTLDISEGGSSWFPVYFPVFSPGIEVDAGDVIEMVCDSILSDNGINPDYSIHGRVVRQNREPVTFAWTSSHHQPSYKQTDFYQRLFGEDAIPVRTQSHRGQIRSEIREHLRTRLPEPMLPSSFVLLEHLPLLPNGKLDRRALPRVDQNRQVQLDAYRAPRTHIERRLAAIWTELLHLEQVSITDNFFEVGGHSLLAVQLLNRINKEFGTWRKAHGLQALSLATLFQVPTIEQAAALLQKEAKPAAQSLRLHSASPIVTLQHAGKKNPIFCVHPGPGVVYSYLDLAKHLRHDRPFYGIQAPGLVGSVPNADPDQDLFESIEEMAASYVNEISTIQPVNSPYFLGGHSFGGYVAFEMARQLQARGDSVALLALMDCYPRRQVGIWESVGADRGRRDSGSPLSVPLRPYPGSSSTAPHGQGQAATPTSLPTPRETIKDYAEPIVKLAEPMSRYWRKKIAVSYDELCLLQPNEQLAYFLDRLRQVQVVPDDMDVPQLRRYLQVHEAHGHSLQRYQPKPYAGRITLFRSESAEEAPSLWAPFSSEPIEVHTVSGDHISMVVEPYVQSLALQLQQCLDKAESV